MNIDINDIVKVEIEDMNFTNFKNKSKIMSFNNDITIVKYYSNGNETLMTLHDRWSSNDGYLSNGDLNVKITIYHDKLNPDDKMIHAHIASFLLKIRIPDFEITSDPFSVHIHKLLPEYARLRHYENKNMFDFDKFFRTGSVTMQAVDLLRQYDASRGKKQSNDFYIKLSNKTLDISNIFNYIDDNYFDKEVTSANEYTHPMSYILDRLGIITSHNTFNPQFDNSFGEIFKQNLGVYCYETYSMYESEDITFEGKVHDQIEEESYVYEIPNINIYLKKEVKSYM